MGPSLSRKRARGSLDRRRALARIAGEGGRRPGEGATRSGANGAADAAYWHDMRNTIACCRALRRRRRAVRLGCRARRTLLTGAAAFGDWRQDAPGTVRKIAAADLPAPFATPSARETATHRPRARRRGQPRVPPGFAVARFADHLDRPARDPGRAERRCLCGGEPRRQDRRVAPAGRFRASDFRHRARQPLRHRFLAARAGPTIRLCRQYPVGRALPVPQRRPPRRERGAGDARLAAGRQRRRALDARHRVFG